MERDILSTGQLCRLLNLVNRPGIDGAFDLEVHDDCILLAGMIVCGKGVVRMDAATEVKASRVSEPAPTEVGLIVAIGGPAGSEAHMVLVDWVPDGHELNLLDTVRSFCEEKAKVIAKEHMTYGDFLKWRAEMRVEDHWSHGKWFYRTRKVMRIFGRRLRSAKGGSKRASKRHAQAKSRVAKRRAA